MASMNLDLDGVKKGTKINSIKVDPRLRVRDDSGLPFVNKVLSGKDAGKAGFVPSTVGLFTGTPGAGKTTLALQLCSTLAENSHEVLYNSGEESLAQVKMTYERLGLKGDFNVGADVFVDRPEGKKDAARVKQTLREHIMFLIKKVKKANDRRKNKDLHTQKRLYIVVDSLQSMNDGKYGFASNNKTPVRVLEELTQICKKNYCGLIVIGQVGKSGDFKGDNTLLHMVDYHMHLYIDQDPKSVTAGCRLLEGRKNRFGPTGIAVALDIGRNGLRENGVRGGDIMGRKV
jgi:DNA repair protein RadA/Sms